MSRTVNLSPGSTVPKTGKYKCEFCFEGRVGDFFGQALKDTGRDDAQSQGVGNQSNLHFFEAGHRFTECPTCGPATGWTLVEEASEIGTTNRQPHDKALSTGQKKTRMLSEKSPDSGRKSKPPGTGSAPLSAVNIDDGRTMPSASSRPRSPDDSERQNTVAPQVLCHKCGSDRFEYDRAWKEYSCKKCGRIVENPERISALKKTIGEETLLNSAKQVIARSRLNQDSTEDVREGRFIPDHQEDVSLTPDTYASGGIMKKQIQIDFSARSVVKLQKGEAYYPWSSYGFMDQIDILAKEEDCLVLTRHYPSILASILAILPALAVGLSIIGGKGGGARMAVAGVVAMAILFTLHRILSRWMPRKQHIQRLFPSKIIRIVRGVDPLHLWPNDLVQVGFGKNSPQKVVYHVFVKSSKKPGKIYVHVFCLALTKEISYRGNYVAAQNQLDSVIARIHPFEKM